MGLTTTDLESLGHSTPQAPNVLNGFWGRYTFPRGQGIAYSLATTSSMLAVNLRELANRWLEHGQRLRFDSAMRQALLQSLDPSFLQRIRTASSRLSGKSIRCCVFECATIQPTSRQSNSPARN